MAGGIRWIVGEKTLQRGVASDGDFHAGRLAGLGRGQYQAVRRCGAVRNNRCGDTHAGFVDRIADTLQRIVGAIDGDSAGALCRILSERGAARVDAVGRRGGATDGAELESQRG